MARLWRDFDGEPYLVNPTLITVNPKRRKKPMRLKRDGSGRFLPRGKSNPKRRRRRRHARPNTPVPNATHRRRARRHHASGRRRRYRSNPPGLSLMGFQLPSIQTIAWTGTGFLAPSFAEGFMRRYLPTELYASPLGRYVVKIGSVLGLGWLAGSFAGSEARNKVLLGGSVYVLANLVSDYLPRITAGTSAPAPATSTGLYQPVGHQPMIGAGRYTPVGSLMTNNAPERLRPENRY